MKNFIRKASLKFRIYLFITMALVANGILLLQPMGPFWLPDDRRGEDRLHLAADYQHILEVDAALLSLHTDALLMVREIQDRAISSEELYQRQQTLYDKQQAIQAILDDLIAASHAEVFAEKLNAVSRSLNQGYFNSLSQLVQSYPLVVNNPEEFNGAYRQLSDGLISYQEVSVSIKDWLGEGHEIVSHAVIKEQSLSVYYLTFVGVVCISLLTLMFVFVMTGFHKRDKIIRRVMDLIPDPVVVKNWQGNFVYCNRTTANLYNASPKDMLGKDDGYFTGNQEQAEFFRENVRGIMTRLETEMVYEDSTDANTGEVRHFNSLKIPFRNEYGELNIAVIARDVTDIVNLKNLAEKNERRLESILEVSGEGLWDWNTQTNEVLHNRQWELITGIHRSENSFEEFESCILDEDKGRVRSALHLLIETDTPYNIEFRIKRPDGTVIWLWDRGQVVERDENGQALWLVGIMQDITNEKANQEKIESLAFYDALTMLPNRSLLEDRIVQTIKHNRRQDIYAAVLFLDLDRFKLLNDTYGHHIGDLLLIEVANRIQMFIRDEDTVARFGGDEFVMILGELDPDPIKAAFYAQGIAEKIRSAVSERYHLGGDEDTIIDYSITASIGGVVFQSDDAEPSKLLQLADMALYRVKSEGRNDSVIFDPDMQDELNRITEIKKDLRSSIKNQDFSVYYQPKFNHQNQIIGAEGLVRWIHPEHGMIGPDVFISIAEESNLIISIGYFVLEQACQQLQAWASDKSRVSLSLSVNLSAKQIWQKTFVEDVKSILNRYDFDCRKLTLELTESVLLQDIDDAIRKLHELRKLGVCFSLDDFGTGFSSLSYLKNLPIDEIKIDRSFVRDIIEDKSDLLLVKSIIDLGQNFNLEVVSEGVENREQLERLLELGCYKFQGYYFSKPLPYKKFDELLDTMPATVITLR